MAARHYRLYYFDARGRAEFIRWLFAYTGQPFEDIRTDAAQHSRVQSGAPLGAFPYLEVDRKPLGEPLAIGRYLARNFNLAGKDHWEAAQIDALVDFLYGTASKLYSYIDDTIRIKGSDNGDALKGDIMEDLQKPIRRLEDVLLKNSRGDGFLMGLHLTWADLFLACFLESIESVSPGFLETRPLLEAYFARVCSLKGIADWLSKRPETPY